MSSPALVSLFMTTLPCHYILMSLRRIAEARIRDAIEQGVFDNLPGAGKPLDLERYFREDRASCITEDVRRVTGRKPGRFALYVQATASTGVWNGEVAQDAN